MDVAAEAKVPVLHEHQLTHVPGTGKQRKNRSKEFRGTAKTKGGATSKDKGKKK